MRASGCCDPLSCLCFSRRDVCHRSHAQLAHPYHPSHRRLARASSWPPLRARRPPPSLARRVRAPLWPRPLLVVVRPALRARAPERVPRLAAPRVRLAFGARRAASAPTAALRFHVYGHRSPPVTRRASSHPLVTGGIVPYRARRAPFFPASLRMSCRSIIRRCSRISSVSVFPVFTLPPTVFSFVAALLSPAFSAAAALLLPAISRRGSVRAPLSPSLTRLPCLRFA